MPPGFVITGEAYLDAIGRAGIRERLVAILAEARTASQDDLDRLAAEARDLVHAVPIPKDLADGIVKAYRKLGKNVRVAVRSSGIGEDAEGTSFAGMNETFTNVAGEEHVLRRVVDCWASLWKARSIFYRGRQGPDRGAVHRRGGTGDDPLGALGCDVHDRSFDRRDGSHRDRGRVRPGRGGGERTGRARHLRGVEGGASPPARPRGNPVLRDRAWARRRGPAGRARRRRGRPQGALGPGGHRGGAHRPGHRGALRLAAGHGVGHGRRQDLPGAVTARDRRGRPRRSGRHGRNGHPARARAGGLGGPGLRGRARAADTRSGRAPAGR